MHPMFSLLRDKLQSYSGAVYYDVDLVTPNHFSTVLPHSGLPSSFFTARGSLDDKEATILGVIRTKDCITSNQYCL